MTQRELEYLNKYDRLEKEKSILSAWVLAFATAFIGAVLLATGLFAGSPFLVYVGLGTVVLGLAIPSLAWLKRNYYISVGKRY